MRINVEYAKAPNLYAAYDASNKELLGSSPSLLKLVRMLRNTYTGCSIFDLDNNQWINFSNNNHSEQQKPPFTNQQKLEPATRYDAGKIPYHLFPLDAYEEICKVMAFGAKKYAERNWEQGMSWSRVARSMLSHFISMCRGEQNDSESNLPHAAHMAWNAIVLLAYTLRPKLRNLNDLSNLYSGTKE